MSETGRQENSKLSSLQQFHSAPLLLSSSGGLYHQKERSASDFVENLSTPIETSPLLDISGSEKASPPSSRKSSEKRKRLIKSKSLINRKAPSSLVQETNDIETLKKAKSIDADNYNYFHDKEGKQQTHHEDEQNLSEEEINDDIDGSRRVRKMSKSKSINRKSMPEQNRQGGGKKKGTLERRKTTDQVVKTRKLKDSKFEVVVMTSTGEYSAPFIITKDEYPRVHKSNNNNSNNNNSTNYTMNDSIYYDGIEAQLKQQSSERVKRSKSKERDKEKKRDREEVDLSPHRSRRDKDPDSPKNERERETETSPLRDKSKITKENREKSGDIKEGKGDLLFTSRKIFDHYVKDKGEAKDDAKKEKEHKRDSKAERPHSLRKTSDQSIDLTSLGPLGLFIPKRAEKDKALRKSHKRNKRDGGESNTNNTSSSVAAVTPSSYYLNLAGIDEGMYDALVLKVSPSNLTPNTPHGTPSMNTNNDVLNHPVSPTFATNTSPSTSTTAMPIFNNSTSTTTPTTTTATSTNASTSSISLKSLTKNSHGHRSDRKSLEPRERPSRRDLKIDRMDIRRSVKYSSLKLIRDTTDVEEEFEILGLVGQGSFGAVFRAIHRQSGTVIALKKQIVKSSEVVREILIMEKLKSEYIVGYFGSQRKGDIMWIVMEMMCYGSLNDVMTITDKTFNEHQIATVCQHVLLGIEYMKSVDKIHRDIKPSNILVNEKGQAKICDFGISSNLSKSEKRKTIIGTPYYLAPEIIDKIGYDSQADVWALGISAIELAEGEPPLHDAHALRVIYMIPLNPSPTLSNPDHWSAEFNDFLSCILKKDPTERPSPLHLLNHPFIKDKSSPTTLFPILDAAANFIQKHGGSLDEALKEALASGKDMYSTFSEKELFGEFSDIESANEHAATHSDSGEEFLSDDITFSLDLSDIDDDSQEGNSEEQGGTHANSGVESSNKSRSEHEPEQSTHSNETTTSSASKSVKSLRRISSSDPSKSSTESKQKNKLENLNYSTPLPISPSGSRIGKLTLDEKELESMSSRDFNRDLLLSTRMSSSDLTSFDDRDGLRTPRPVELNEIDSNHLPHQALVRVQRDTELKKMRTEIKKQKTNEMDVVGDFKSKIPDYCSLTENSYWKGIGTSSNPWRNHSQFKVTLSQPSIVCINITYYTDALLDLGEITLVVLSVKNVENQIILKPRGSHSTHTWNTSPYSRKESLACRIAFEDESMTYVLVPTVNSIGVETVHFEISILFAPETGITISPLPMMNSLSILGEWTKFNSGGSTNGSTWRKNPQYKLTISEDVSDFYLFLAQIPPVGAENYFIGFYVIYTNQNTNNYKLIDIENTDIIVQEQKWRTSSEITTVKKLKLKKGVYIVIPCTFYPNKCSKFMLTAASSDDSRISWEEITENWYSNLVEGKWTQELSGGCVSNDHQLWRKNPLFHLQLEQDGLIELFIDRKPWLKKNEKPFIGMYIFKGEVFEIGGISRASLVAKTSAFTNSREVYLRCNNLAAGSYIVLVATFYAGFIGNFLLHSYSHNRHKLSIINPLKCLSLSDKWDELQSGGTIEYETWRKNPQFYLQGIPGTNLQIILEQNKLIEKLDVVEYDNKHKASPFVSMGFYVLFYDGEIDQVKKVIEISSTNCVPHITQFSKEERIAFSTKLPLDHTGLIIMPTTFKPNIQNQFRLSVHGNFDVDDIVFKKITDSLHKYTHNSSWSIENNTAGGCHNYKKGDNPLQFLDNPAVAVVATKTTKINIILKQDPDNLVAAGIYLLERKPNTELSRRSVLCFSEFKIEHEVVLNYTIERGIVYMILFSTFDAMIEKSFTSEIYTSKELGNAIPVMELFFGKIKDETFSWHADLIEIGGASCVNDVHRCISLMIENQFDEAQTVSEVLLEISWEQLHSGHWKDVALEWRELYALSTFLWAYSAFTWIGALEVDGVDIIKKLDMGLMMGGPRYHPFIHQMIDDLHEYDESNDEVPILIQPPIIYPTIQFPIQRITNPSLLSFSRDFMLAEKPVIITNGMENWPAVSSSDRNWKDLSYIKKKSAHRWVPVEIGPHYSDSNWRQTMMTMSDFIFNHIENDQGEVGYLAQTQLFEQIPEFKKDILVPDYCNLGDFDEPIVNAWFGPKGTVSSLHHDRYHNLLCQVVGEKYIRIYHPNQTEFLYVNSEDKLLFNTSQVDAEHPNLEKFPLFSNAVYTEYILKEKEMLYIPPLHWHYVRSLSTSFSTDNLIRRFDRFSTVKFSYTERSIRLNFLLEYYGEEVDNLLSRTLLLTSILMESSQLSNLST